MLLISSMIFQPFLISCTMCFPSLFCSLFHYVSICVCIKPSNKAKRLITKATNQGSQLVVFLDIFVGGYSRGNALGNKLAMGHEIIEKKSRHVQNMKHFARSAHVKNQV